MLCVLRAGWQPCCTLWLIVLEKCGAQPAGWCSFTVSVMQCMFQSCSALSMYGSIWLYSGFICSIIKFVIVSLCLINEHWCQWGMQNNGMYLKNTCFGIHLSAFACSQMARKMFARICLTSKALVKRFPQNLGTQRVTWSKFPPEDPQSCSDLWTLPLSGAFCFVHVYCHTYFIEGKRVW
jgi:hypothetical protein